MGRRGGSWSKAPVVLSGRAGCSLVPPHPAAEPGPYPALVLQLCLMEVDGWMDGWIQRPILGATLHSKQTLPAEQMEITGIWVQPCSAAKQNLPPDSSKQFVGSPTQRLPENVCVLVLLLHMPCKI